MTEYTTISIKRSQRPLFEQAKNAVEKELGEEPTQIEVIEEVCRAYTGNDACGAWKEVER